MTKLFLGLSKEDFASYCDIQIKENSDSDIWSITEIYWLPMLSPHCCDNHSMGQ